MYVSLPVTPPPSRCRWWTRVGRLGRSRPSRSFRPSVGGGAATGERIPRSKGVWVVQSRRVWSVESGPLVCTGTPLVSPEEGVGASGWWTDPSVVEGSSGNGCRTTMVRRTWLGDGGRLPSFSRVSCGRVHVRRPRTGGPPGDERHGVKGPSLSRS